MTELPRLYKKTKTGAIQICDIQVAYGGLFTVTWGQLDGAKQEKSTICIPKNVGRKNETTPEEQAMKEALAKHKKKIDEGYSLTIEKPSEILLPQKVKVYQDQLKNVVFPCIAMVKLNGINGEYRLIDGKLRLLSRGGLDYEAIPQHVESILLIMKKLDTTSLNGEIYCHGMHLQDISAAVKKHNKHTPALLFRVFDFPEIDSTYEEDVALLDYIRDLHNRGVTSWVNSIVAHIVTSHRSTASLLDRALGQGYEGLVIRNLKGKYKYNQRSSDVFKYKLAKDAEYKIVDMNIDKNGHPVFVCETENKTFKVKPKGTNEERLQMVKDYEKLYKGKFLKTEFEMLSKDGIPLKPVGLGLRVCDSEGNPTE